MLPSRDASPNDDEEEENEQTEENVMFSSLMKLCLERERERLYMNAKDHHFMRA